MDAGLAQLAAQQDDVFARWQLRRLGWSRHAIQHEARARRWRTIHEGVYTPSQAPLSQRQLWVAATLTAPGTYLNAFSATNAYGYHLSDLGYETVVRRGSGGKRAYPGLLVARSSTLDAVVGEWKGLRIVSPERALVEIAPDVADWQLGRAFREACRLKCTTAEKIGRELRGQRGTAALAVFCERYAQIPYHRCRSDAESRALEVFWDGGIPLPLVNVRFRGPRPDFRWPEPRFIIEIDSREFHQFPDVDAEYQAAWEAGGARVRRFPATRVYSHPEELVALYHSNVLNDRLLAARRDVRANPSCSGP